MIRQTLKQQQKIAKIFTRQSFTYPATHYSTPTTPTPTPTCANNTRYYTTGIFPYCTYEQDHHVNSFVFFSSIFFVLVLILILILALSLSFALSFAFVLVLVLVLVTTNTTSAHCHA